jgi:hypothetical protein
MTKWPLVRVVAAAFNTKPSIFPPFTQRRMEADWWPGSLSMQVVVACVGKTSLPVSSGLEKLAGTASTPGWPRSCSLPNR